MVEDKVEILKLLNEDFSMSQRKLSKKSGISLGKVNGIIKELALEKFIIKISSDKKVHYKITDSGMKYLEKNIAGAKNTRLKLHEEEKKEIYQAVILAAGKSMHEIPSGLLEIEDFKIIDRTINILKENGIRKIVLEEIS